MKKARQPCCKPDPHFQTLLKYTKPLADGINKAYRRIFVKATKFNRMLHTSIPQFPKVINTSLLKFDKAANDAWHEMHNFKLSRSVGEFIRDNLKTILETFSMTGSVWVLGSLSPMNGYISDKKLIKFDKDTMISKSGKNICTYGHSHDLPLTIRSSIVNLRKSVKNYLAMPGVTGLIEQLGEEAKRGPVVVFDDSYGSGLSMMLILGALKKMGYEQWFKNVHPIALVYEKK